MSALKSQNLLLPFSILVAQTILYGSSNPAVIYEECSFLCRNFSRVSFSHSPREANRAAHILAKFFKVDHEIWHADPPNCVCSVITDDVTIVPN